MKIQKTELDAVFLRTELLTVCSMVKKHGWEKLITTVGDLRTLCMDDTIDAMCLPYAENEPVEIEGD